MLGQPSSTENAAVAWVLQLAQGHWKRLRVFIVKQCRLVQTHIV